MSLGIFCFAGLEANDQASSVGQADNMGGESRLLSIARKRNAATVRIDAQAALHMEKISNMQFGSS